MVIFSVRIYMRSCYRVENDIRGAKAENVIVYNCEIVVAWSWVFFVFHNQMKDDDLINLHRIIVSVVSHRSYCHPFIDFIITSILHNFYSRTHHKT